MDSPLYTFRRNKKQNPYSVVVDNFLKRQMILFSNYHLVMHTSMMRDVNFFGYIMYVTEAKTRKMITTEGGLAIWKKNKKAKEKDLQNYLGVSLIAQTFENFETLIKDIYRTYLRLHIKEQFILERYQLPRTNAEIIKDLKKCFPSLNTYLNEKILMWIFSVEKLRHAIVHNDQVVTAKLVESHKAFFQQHFELKQLKGDRYRAFIVRHEGEQIIRRFDGYGYNIFACLSEDSSLPINLKPHKPRKRKSSIKL